MRVLHIEAFSGMAGDMFMAALVDAGLDLKALESALAGLGLDRFRLERREVMRGAIRATKMDVIIRDHEGVERQEGRDQDHQVHGRPQVGPDEGDAPRRQHDHGAGAGRHEAHGRGSAHGHAHGHEHHHGHGHDHHHGHGHDHAHDHGHDHQHGHDHAHGFSYREIHGLIAGSGLPAKPRERALAIFRRLAEAEARIHGMRPEDVQFHEVGAIDGIVDVCAAALGLDLLGIDKVTAGPVGIGEGLRRMAHGLVPIPAPATAEIVKGMPLRRTGIADELLTPTGAAILAVVVDEFEPRGDFVIESTGYGAGSTDRADPPNVVRVLLGRSAENGVRDDRVIEITTQVDDMTGEALGQLRATLEEGGVLDFLIQPVQMKKDRPGQLLTLILRPEDEERLGALLLKHSTSLGYRRREVERRVLKRREETLTTPWGEVRIKVATLGDGTTRWKAEHDDLVAIARRTGRSIAEIEAGLRALRPD